MENSTTMINMQITKLRSAEYVVQLAVYSFIVFMAPLMIGHPQWAVGIAVNCALVLSALYMDFKGTLPAIALPSLAVLSRGMIFGPFTVYLIYMIPFIWAGNAILVYGMKYLHIHRRHNYALSLCLSSLIKAGFLLGCAAALVWLGIVPPVFITTMGVIQFVTAIGGGIAAYGISWARSALSSRA